jgi:hypothetical protein
VPTVWQVRAPVHIVHAAPPEPHFPLFVPGLHEPPSQQPFGHETTSHTQAPPTQWLPPVHGVVAPH